MIVGKKYIFIHLPKCGGLHLSKILIDNFEGEFWGSHEEDYHNTLMDKITCKKIIGCVRNPLSFYVSMWAYGCKGLGWLNIRIKELLPNKRYLYNDPKNKEHFREWLRLIMNPPEILHQLYGLNNLGESKNKNIGIFTLRYIYLYQKGDFSCLNNIKDDKLTDYMIKQESLEKDFSYIMKDMGYHIEKSIFKTRKENSSEHLHFKEYYDDETRKLVENKDNYIFRKFNYTH